MRNDPAILELAKRGDLESRNRIIVENIGLIDMVAKRMGGQLEDYLAAGTLGIIAAIRKWDAARKCQFSTFAFWSIRCFLSTQAKKEKRTLRVFTGQVDDFNSFAAKPVTKQSAESMPCMDTLTERERGILALRGGGMNYTDIAEYIGLSKQGVHCAVHRACAKLRDRIGAAA